MRRSAPTTPLSKTVAAALAGAAIVLSACTSTQEVLEPSALVDTGNSNTGPQGPVAAIATNARVHFAPVIGAPDQAAASLGARLAARASERGINLTAAGDGATTHVMRGYFSTIADNGETTVIYVWDVVDPAGTRIHRIQGQARSGAGAQGWSSVSAPTMEAIADQTVDQLAVWLASAQG